MRARILTVAVAFLLPTCACGQAGVSASADSTAIHDLLGQYAKAVDSVDLKLLAEIWSHSPDVSFIYPLGEEHGFEAIEQHVFEKVMGGMFSARDLTMHHVAIYVNGDAARSEFNWEFHATLRKDGSAIITHVVETQIYRKEVGQWRLVHVPYSEDRQPAP
jgi:ketosteroid isomerase-like protein